VDCKKLIETNKEFIERIRNMQSVINTKLEEMNSPSKGSEQFPNSFSKKQENIDPELKSKFFVR
jgi:hypothetical protein